MQYRKKVFCLHLILYVDLIKYRESGVKKKRREKNARALLMSAAYLCGGGGGVEKRENFGLYKPLCNQRDE